MSLGMGRDRRGLIVIVAAIVGFVVSDERAWAAAGDGQNSLPVRYRSSVAGHCYGYQRAVGSVVQLPADGFYPFVTVDRERIKEQTKLDVEAAAIEGHQCANRSAWTVLRNVPIVMATVGDRC